MKFLSPRWVHSAMPRDYWHVLEPIGKHIRSDSIGGYYIDMRAKARKFRGPSKDGFPLRNQNGESLQLLPVTVTQMALGHYDCYLEDRSEDRIEIIRRCADWLCQRHGPCPGKMNGWSYEFDHGRLSIRAPFISAMGQGQGISLLIRAHQLIGDDRYLQTAQEAFRPFLEPVEKGGVTAFMPDGSIVFEEYPSLPYSHVLNGLMFALWGVYDLGLYLDDAAARDLAKTAAKTLAATLPRYDIGYWSRYCLFPHPQPNVASPFYHELHIAQLTALHRLYPEPIFLQYADKWAVQFESWRNFVRALRGKVQFKRWVKSTKQKIRSANLSPEDALGIWVGQ